MKIEGVESSGQPPISEQTLEAMAASLQTGEKDLRSLKDALESRSRAMEAKFADRERRC